MEESGNIKIVFHKDTELLLFDGTVKKVSDVEENDILFGIPPLKNIVKKKYFSKENLYRIITRYGNSFIVGEDTQFLVFDNKNFIFEHINVNQYLFLNNDCKNTLSVHKTHFEYNEFDVDIDPYFVGIILGNVDSLFIKIKHDNNPFFLTSMNETIETLKLKKMYGVKECTILISDISLNDEIKKKYDFLFSSKYIPDDYKKNSIDIRRKLLAGIIDINSVEKSNYIEIRNLNKTLAFDIYNLLFSIGLFHVLIVREKDHYNIQIFGSTSNIRFSTKYEPKPHICNNFKVASMIEKECIVIEVENGNSIVLSDLTVI